MSILGDLAGGAIERITIESNLSPVIVLDHPLAEGQAGADAQGQDSYLDPMRLVRPRVTVKVAGADAPFVFEPAGAPSDNVRLGVGLGAVALVLLALYGAYCLVKRR